MTKTSLKTEEKAINTWRTVKLGDVISTARINFEKVKTSEYQRLGYIPIYDQGSDTVAGYTNNSKAEFKGKLPAILFGDHTLKLKLVETPFAIGADGVQILEPDETLLDRKFFFYALKGSKIKSYGYERHMKYLRELEIICPDLIIQKTIAGILSAFDEKIENNNRIIKTLEEMAQAIFKEWFVNAASAADSVSLTDLADFVNGGAFGKIVNRSRKGMPLVKIAEFSRGITENTEYIDEKVSDKYLVKDGDLLFSWSGSLELHIWHKGDAVLNQHLFNVIPKDSYSRGLLYVVLHSKLPWFRQIAQSKATSMGHIQRHHLEEQQILIPVDKDLSIFNEIYGKLVSALIENQKLAAMRDLLLPRLMSGEIQV